MAPAAHRCERQSAEFHVRENEHLKLARDQFRRDQLGGTKMTAPGVVDHHVETSRFSRCVPKTIPDRTRVREVQANRVNPRRVGHAFRIARGSPNLVALRREELRGCSSDA